MVSGMLLPYAVNVEFKCDEAQATVSNGKQLLLLPLPLLLATLCGGTWSLSLHLDLLAQDTVENHSDAF